ncbi:hypothetical protein [Seonamhaeicola maritimus]|uniref:hypothetical protein n=1 Tax=Seonamhaeicola maritimus TaxID=2591822 RepID=UPI0024945B2F|nr:hypothetical protein [Seonamhaeicola maritimus]
MGRISKIFVVVAALLLVDKAFSQDSLEVKKTFEKIELSINHDRKVFDKLVHLTIYNRPKPKTTEIVIRTLDSDEPFKHWLMVKPDFKYEISKSLCEDIEELLLSIDFNDFVILDNRIGIHGYRCELTYGDSLSSISLSAWTPTIRTEERQLQTYLKVCNMILKAAKMEEL